MNPELAAVVAITRAFPSSIIYPTLSRNPTSTALPCKRCGRLTFFVDTTLTPYHKPCKHADLNLAPIPSNLVVA